MFSDVWDDSYVSNDVKQGVNENVECSQVAEQAGQDAQGFPCVPALRDGCRA